MSLPLRPPYPVMEADTVHALPAGDGWQFEPKWDGFRGLVFRDGGEVLIQSKSGEPLARYFPELVEAFASLKARRFVIDGEMVIARKSGLSFDDLLQRIHPAASRVRRLASETPATFIAFDLLVDGRGRSLVTRPLAERRSALETFARAQFPRGGALRLSAATTDPRVARRWFAHGGGALDGVVAKRLDMPYRGGERDAMLKVKHQRTADCVVGGFRYADKEQIVGSLLLGLYDEDGLLHHVGYTSSLGREDRRALTPKLEKRVRPPGFTGRAPGGPSRWSTRRSTEWQPLAAGLVVEVQYDHVSNGRFRHGTKFLRWRPDKAPRQCTMEQIERRAVPLERWLQAG